MGTWSSEGEAADKECVTKPVTMVDNWNLILYTNHGTQCEIPQNYPTWSGQGNYYLQEWISRAA